MFHYTHHRSVTDAAGMARYDLGHGVLAFGQFIVAVPEKRVIGPHTVWHEGADRIGNWGDNERTAELQEYLFGPVA